MMPAVLPNERTSSKPSSVPEGSRRHGTHGIGLSTLMLAADREAGASTRTEVLINRLARTLGRSSCNSQIRIDLNAEERSFPPESARIRALPAEYPGIARPISADREPWMRAPVGRGGMSIH